MCTVMSWWYEYSSIIHTISIFVVYNTDGFIDKYNSSRINGCNSEYGGGTIWQSHAPSVTTCMWQTWYIHSSCFSGNTSIKTVIWLSR
jgi:hypothetical protein